ncbi:MAG: hypothetical protein ACREU2_03010 [Steroidobacteraceae bacterium]
MTLVIQNFYSVTQPQISPYLPDSPFGFAWTTIDTSRHRAAALARTGSVRQRFRKLARIWREETLYSSVLEEKLTHPAYLEIIDLGQSAIPLILSELRSRPSHWFRAIDSIVGHPILPQDFAGGFSDAVAAYLAWGERLTRGPR